MIMLQSRADQKLSIVNAIFAYTPNNIKFSLHMTSLNSKQETYRLEGEVKEGQCHNHSVGLTDCLKKPLPSLAGRN